jgi:hypothetical protein
MLLPFPLVYKIGGIYLPHIKQLAVGDVTLVIPSDGSIQIFIFIYLNRKMS